jgi:hypothetical protein
MLRWVSIQYCGQRGDRYGMGGAVETPVSLIDQAPTIVIQYVDAKVNDNRNEKTLPRTPAGRQARNRGQAEIAKARKGETEEKKRAAAEADAPAPGSSRNPKPKQMLFPVTLVPFERSRSGTASTPTPAKIQPARFGSTSSPISATGKTTTRIKRRFSGCR